ncbi:LON peptidase substrate-binding domain-containing protein [Actinomarinicola tropica]|uniref:Lon N-terminal domain-containing protein n=1 Tax=Actinomarinicola tropica TaxID=2789776 RepID=A0A5Q2RER8_9ACTN|nr:LON peptidase substrate-binding domain-containing protein [Actinomarinicola tropica]QGG95309.1 hypothetical protein GH723_09490 [Actinomarinicola tropica]
MTAEPREMAMFPLGTVLVPTAVLPLHVFEPRYRELVDAVLATEARELGVVLIERGSEVGGGDARTSVGTVAGVIDAQRTDDGRWGLVTVGLRRIEVARWLPDEPYPRALVTDWPDADDATPSDELEGLRATAVTLVRQALAVATELGEAPVPATVDLSDDPVTASFQVVAAGPLGPADRQALLEVPGARERLERAAVLLGEAIELMRARIALGGP